MPIARIKQGVIVAVAVVVVSALAACGGSSAGTPSPTTAVAAATATTAATAVNTPAAPPRPSPTTSAATTAVATATPIAAASATATSLAGPGVTGTLAIGGLRLDQLTAAPNVDVVYAATAAGLYRRTGTGDWTPVSSRPVTGQLLVDPSNPNVLYQGDHAPCARGGATVAFQKSTNGGRTWQTLPGGQDMRPWVIDPANPSRIYGDKCRLAVSVDGGQTWTTTPVVPSFDVSSMALAGSTLEVIATSEGGTSRLVPVDVGVPGKPVVGATQLEFWGGGSVVVSGGRLVIAEPHGVHVSIDGGKTWSFSRAGLEPVTVSVDALSTPIPQVEIAQGFGIFAVAVDPGQPDAIVAGTIHGLYRSTDGGKTWRVDPAIGPIRVRALAFAGGGAQLYVTTDEGVTLLTGA